MSIIRWLLCLLNCLLLWGCEKAISFDLEESKPMLVVDASIESGAAPRVVLTKSLNYFAQISPGLLVESFVSGARVSVSDGTTTHMLKEYKTPVGAGLFLTYYAPDTSMADYLKGELNKEYNLQIEADGQQYSATTSIPDTTRRIDSIWWKPVPNTENEGEVSIYVRATDREGFGNYIRYFTKRNSDEYLPPANSVFDDYVIDGSTYEISVAPGFDRNRLDTGNGDSPDNYFRRGDTVTMKLADIDKTTYDFWRTMEYSYGTVGNPFSTPIKVSGNISGGALGYFGGYAVRYFQIIIPK